MLYKKDGEVVHFSMKPDTIPIIRKIQGGGRNVYAIRDWETHTWVIVIEELEDDSNNDSRDDSSA